MHVEVRPVGPRRSSRLLVFFDVNNILQVGVWLHRSGASTSTGQCCGSDPLATEGFLSYLDVEFLFPGCTLVLLRRLILLLGGGEPSSGGLSSRLWPVWW
jgi:hypothetical protein